MKRNSLWLALLLVLASVSCQQPEPEAPTSLPSAWPVPQLTLPQGAEMTKLFALQESQSTDGGFTIQGAQGAGDFEGTLWAAAFETKMQWLDLVTSVDEKLDEAGYRGLVNPMHGELGERTPAFEYLSSNGMTLIVLARSSERSRPEEGVLVCMYKVTQLKEAWSGDSTIRDL